MKQKDRNARTFQLIFLHDNNSASYQTKHFQSDCAAKPTRAVSSQAYDHALSGRGQGFRPESNIFFSYSSFRGYPASVSKVPSRPSVISTNDWRSCSLSERKQSLIIMPSVVQTPCNLKPKKQLFVDFSLLAKPFMTLWEEK